MTTRTNTERIRAIQRHLKVEPDGQIGPDTLTAIEAALPDFAAHPAPQSASSVGLGLRLSKPGIAAIVRYEIGSDAYYQRYLRKPHWPGGDSGITIGIGYDLGYQTASKFHADWGELLPDRSLERLGRVVGKKGRAAKRVMDEVDDISISLNRARQVFTETNLPDYAKKTKRAYPGIEQLYPDAQSALVSLVFNRGTKMSGSSRREMAAIKDQVANQDYEGIATSLELMKRLWEGRNLTGLLKRRDAEAKMVRESNRHYDADEIVLV